MKLEHLRRLADEIGLILASGSPRRRRILTDAGITFQSTVPRINEIVKVDLPPVELALDLARQKVTSIDMDGHKAYLGCDTIVVLDNKILTKPDDSAHAEKILRTLSGRTHSVFTALALFDSRNKKCYCGHDESRVRFHQLDSKTIEGYIASGEPLDKAGAYGIQGIGGILVDSIEGNIDNVIGLPLSELDRLAGLYMDEYVE